MIFYWIFYPHKIYGKENMPKKGNFIMVCNHFAKVDILVLSALFKRRPYFLAKKELMNGKITGKIFRRYGLIPIDREKADFAAMKECFSVLKKGENLVIFIEGTRNKENDELQQVKGGASMIAFKAGVPILPVMMHSRFKMFRKNYAIIGKPFDFSAHAGEKLNAELTETLTEEVKDRMLVCQNELGERLRKKKK